MQNQPGNQRSPTRQRQPSTSSCAFTKYFIPTLYFVEGLPFAIVNVTSAIVFKSFGAGVAFIGASSLLSMPWMFKFLWSPLVDAIGNKKRWVVITQFLIAAIFILLAVSVNLAHPIFAFACMLVLLAFTAATQDIAIDGYYLEILNVREQSFYVGIRNTFYRLALLFGSGVLVYAAGKLAAYYGVGIGWGSVFCLLAVLVLTATLFHVFVLPVDKRKTPVEKIPITEPITPVRLFQTFGNYLRVFGDYLNQPGITAILIYILTFRLGDALLLKMAPIFLLDARSSGGLGLSIDEVGLVYGTLGTAALLAGGIAGSYLIARDGLKRWILPFALAQNLAIPLYWYLSVARPSLYAVASVNFVEQAAYGLGVTAFTIFILQTVKPDHRAAHYAIATALMAAGMLLPSAFSGVLAARFGYTGLFQLSTIAAIPGIAAIFFLPLTKHTVPS